MKIIETILGDGTILNHQCVIRYGKGVNTLFLCESAAKTPVGIRLGGINIMGDTHVAWPENCSKASPEDICRWNATRVGRNFNNQEIIPCTFQ